MLGPAAQTCSGKGLRADQFTVLSWRQLLSEIIFGFFHPESWRDELLVLAVLRDSPIPRVRPQWVGFCGTYILSVTCRAHPEVPREPILWPLTAWPFLCRLPEGKVILCRTPGR